MKLQTSIKPSCPRCGSDKLVKFGKHPKTKEQKFRCNRCLHQFMPNHLSTRKTSLPKYGFCPRCGHRLEQRKRNRNTIQLRCSNRPVCKYTISYNFKLKAFFDFAIRSKDFFKLPKFFKFPMKIVYKALKFSLIFNLSSRKISAELGGKPSHVTIMTWIHKFAYLFTLLYNNRCGNNISSEVWHIDDTCVKIAGQKFRLFIVLDSVSRFVLGWFLSPTKDKNACRMVLELALRFSGVRPQIIISDNASYIQLAIKEMFGDNVEHIMIGLYENENGYSNNRLERFFSNIKSCLKNRKYLRSFKSGFALIGAIIVIYNFSKHSALGVSPKEKLGINWVLPILGRLVTC